MAMHESKEIAAPTSLGRIGLGSSLTFGLFGSSDDLDDGIERLENSHGLRASFQSTLEVHPVVRDDLEWPSIIAEDVNVGQAFCIDAHVDDMGEILFAVGFNNGEVRCSPRRASSCVDEMARSAADTPVIYKHQSRVISLMFSSTGLQLASSSWDGRIVVYDFLERHAMFSNLTSSFHFAEFPAIQHGVCACQVAWSPDDTTADILAVAVSRVRKFQGQTHPARIPGGLIVGHCVELCLSDASPSSNGKQSMTCVPSGGHRMIDVPTTYFDNGSDKVLPAVWCTSIANSESIASMNLLKHPAVLQAFPPASRLALKRMSTGATSHLRGSSSYSRASDKSEVAGGLPTMLVAAGCGDSTVRLFAVVNNALVQLCSLAGHNVISTNGGIWDVCFLPRVGAASICTGSRCSSDPHGDCLLASAGEDNDIRVWDCGNQCCLLVLSQGVSQGFGVVRIRPYVDRKTRFTRTWDVISNIFQTLNPQETEAARKKASTRSETVGSLESSLGQDSAGGFPRQSGVEKLMLLAANWDNSLRLWDVESASPHSVFTNVHADAVLDVVPVVIKTSRTSEDMEVTALATCLRCMTVSRDRTLKLWNYEVGTAEQITKMHTGPIVGILQLPLKTAAGKEFFLSVCASGLVSINDYSTRTPDFQCTLSHSKKVMSLTGEPGPEGQVAFGDDVGEVHVYRPRLKEDGSPELGPKLCQLSHGEQSKSGVHEIVCIGFLRRDVGDTLIATSCYCGEFSLWRERDSEPLYRQQLKSAQHAICCEDGATLPNDKTSVTLITGGDKDVSGIISLWHVERRGMVVVPEQVGSLHGHQDRVLCFALGPHGIHLASSGFDSTILVWHLPSRTLIRSLRHHSGNVRCLRFRPFTNGSLLISASEDKKLLIWRVGCAKVENIFLGHRFAVNAMTISNDGRSLFTGDAGGTIMRRSLDSSALSLLVVWQSFLKMCEEMRGGGTGRIEASKDLFKTFVGPPSLVLQNTLFPFRFTLLHYFTMIGDVNAIRLCFEAAQGSSGASSLPVGFKRDSENLTPLDWAVSCDHMDCADELLRQAAKYPWQFGLILAPSIPGILARIAQHGWRLKYLPAFLDSRLMAPQPGHGLPLMMPMASRTVPRVVVQGLSCPTLTMEEYAHLYKVRIEDMSAANERSCSARVLYIPGFIRAVMDLQQTYGITPGSMDDATLQCDTWEVLTSYLWNTKYFPLYLVYLCSYAFHLFLGLYYLLLLRTYQDDRTVFQKYVCGAGVCLVNAQLLLAEMVQLKSAGFREYFSDKFNYLQLFMYSVFLICVVVDFCGLFSDFMPVFASLLSLSGVFNLLCVSRGFLEFGIVVRMFFEVIYALRYFLLVMLVVMGGFIISITLLADFHNDEDGENDWLEFLFALLQVGLLGEYQGGLLMESVSHERVSFVMAFEYWLFTFLLMIVLLNLLIAVMNNQFETLRKQSVIEAKKGRYEVMGDLDTSQVSQIVVRGLRKIFLGHSGFVYPTFIVVYGDAGRASQRNQRVKEAAQRTESPGESREPRSTQELDMRIAGLVVSHFNEFRQGMESCMISRQNSSMRSSGLIPPTDKKHLAEYTRSVVIRTIEDLASRNMLHPDALKGPLTWSADALAREESLASNSRPGSSESRKARRGPSELVPLLELEAETKDTREATRSPVVEI